MLRGTLDRLAIMMRLALEKRVFIVLCSVILLISALAIFANMWSSNKIITSLAISGNIVIPELEIISTIHTPIINTTKNQISLQQIRRDVLHHPYVQSVAVEGSHSNQINIEIKERKPLAIIVGPDGSLVYYDENAVALPYRLSEKFHDMPLLRGVFVNGKIDTVCLLCGIKIIKELSKETYRTLYSITSEVIYQQDQKLFYLMTADAGVKIMLGETGNLDDKLDLLLAYWKEKGQKAKTANSEYIDLRWKDQLVVRDYNQGKTE